MKCRGFAANINDAVCGAASSHLQYLHCTFMASNFSQFIQTTRKTFSHSSPVFSSHSNAFKMYLPGYKMSMCEISASTTKQWR